VVTEAIKPLQPTLTTPVRAIGEANAARVVSKTQAAKPTDERSNQQATPSVSGSEGAAKSSNPRAVRLAKLVELTTCSMDDAKLRPPYLRRERASYFAPQAPGRRDCSSAMARTSGL
jgi:hypothetical protein